MSRSLRTTTLALAATVLTAAPAAAHDVFPTAGATTLKPSGAAAAAFTAAGVTPTVPASFPVVAGSEYSFHALYEEGGGTLRHDGTLTLTKGSTVVTLTRPVLTIKGSRKGTEKQPNTGATGTLAMTLGTSSLQVATLDLADYEASEKPVGLGGVEARLTRSAADALNAAFATTAFSRGLDLGALSATDIAQPVRFTTAGRSTARLSAATAALLQRRGVRVTRTGGATGTGRAFTFPVTGGAFEVASFVGPQLHRGGLRITLPGGRSLSVANLRLAYEGKRGYVLRSGSSTGRPVFTVGFGPRTTFSSKGRIEVGGGQLFLARETAALLAPTLGVRTSVLTRRQVGTFDTNAPYVTAG